MSRTIRTAADVAEGATWLAAREPRFAAAMDATGPLPLRLRTARGASRGRSIVE